MIVLQNKTELQQFLKANQQQYAFVPTMGNLHAGHLSLIDTARKHSQNVIVSIFVNPTQFSANEDFSTYPRTLEQDLLLLQANNIDAVYIPTIKCIYPTPSKMWFDIPHLTNVLCGKSRPHFFNGVMTVVLKLCLQISPKFLILGEKDYQQFLVVREMVQSIGLEIDVIPSPIVRNQSGLALSSRNSYIKNIAVAEQINQILLQCVNDITTYNKVDLSTTHKKLSQFLEIDYLELRSNDDLLPYTKGMNLQKFRLFFAGKFESVRLIDNIAIDKA
jgi:pantoate--beta-alanine ligase